MWAIIDWKCQNKVKIEIFLIFKTFIDFSDSKLVFYSRFLQIQVYNVFLRMMRGSNPVSMKFLLSEIVVKEASLSNGANFVDSASRLNSRAMNAIFSDGYFQCCQMFFSRLFCVFSLILGILKVYSRFYDFFHFCWSTQLTQIV